MAQPPTREPGIGPKRGATGLDVPQPPTPADAVKTASAAFGPDEDGHGPEGVSASHVFDLDCTDRRGYRWTGRFRSHILTIGERSRVGLVRARLAGGLAPVSLDGDTVDLLEMQAHLAVALDETPDWAKNLDTIRAVEVLAAIYKEVADHEARFWGAGPKTDREIAGKGSDSGA